MQECENKDIKNIDFLKKYEFEIPEYQRGYRWEKEQVDELLDDLYKAFKEKDHKYYLQPIIVKGTNSSINEQKTYKLIDGQQRLTTLYLLLRFMQKKYNFSGDIFRINYNFLFDDKKEKIDVDKKIEEFFYNEYKYESLNDYYFEEALKRIKEWCKKNKEVVFQDFSNYINNNVFIIWYDLEKQNEVSDEDEFKAFLRTNSGKIRLSDADLIKAEFLKNGDEIISREWNEIEKQIYNNKFWYFISNKVTDDRMTEFLKICRGESYDNKALYKYYKDKIIADKENTWKEIKRCYKNFIEWYNDDEIYNYIGYIVKAQINAKDKKDNTIFKYLKKIQEYCRDNKIENRYQFKMILKHEIRSEVLNFLHNSNTDYINLNDIINISNLDNENNVAKTINEFENKIERIDIVNSLDALSYEYDKEKIFKILLLYNILTQNESTESKRFPFDKFFIDKSNIQAKEDVLNNYNDDEKRIIWSLEHIYAQNETKEIKSFSEFKELTKIKDNWDLENISEEEWIKNKEKLNNQLLEELKDEFEFELHGIGNLTLLDKNLNSSNGNDFFVNKRQNIIEKNDYCYIPICTKNVFLKAFKYKEEQRNNQIIMWTQKDYNVYVEDIVNMIFNNIIDLKGDNNER